MNVFRAWTTRMAPCIIVLFCLTVIPSQVASAALIGTEQALSQELDTEQRAKLKAFFDREDVRGVLLAQGVSPDEAKARVDSLTDQELASLSGKLSSLPAGQGDLGVILGATLFIFLVLVITDAVGVTDVFPFVTPI